jgi:uncharacterized coiled-coil protein SlyX
MQPPPIPLLVLLALLVGLVLGHLLARRNQTAEMIDAENEAIDLRNRLRAAEARVVVRDGIIARRDDVIAEQRTSIETLGMAHLQKATTALLTVVGKYEEADRRRTIELKPPQVRALPAAVKSRQAEG